VNSWFVYEGYDVQAYQGQRETGFGFG